MTAESVVTKVVERSSAEGSEEKIVRLARELAQERLRWSLPEYLRADMYSHSAGVEVAFSDGVAVEGGEAQAEAARHVERASALFGVLDDFLVSRNGGWGEFTLREKYRALPKRGRVEKMLAQVYRLLKVVCEATSERHAHVVAASGKIAITVSCGVAHALTITPMGLTLLESFVAYYLTSFRSPFSEAYVEAMLSQYYADIADEVCRFFDEDGVLLQFRRKAPFDRHCRARCPNPKFSVEGEVLIFEIGDYHLERRRSIDFYVMVDGCLYIVPSEALERDRLPLSELPKWRARGAEDPTPYGGRLRLEYLRAADGGPMA